LLPQPGRGSLVIGPQRRGTERDSENTTLTCHSDHIHIVNLLLLLYSKP
jgi:hypothetical protein